jgi:hypothetical protein
MFIPHNWVHSINVAVKSFIVKITTGVAATVLSEAISLVTHLRSNMHSNCRVPVHVALTLDIWNLKYSKRVKSPASNTVQGNLRALILVPEHFEAELQSLSFAH